MKSVQYIRGRSNDRLIVAPEAPFQEMLKKEKKKTFRLSPLWNILLIWSTVFNNGLVAQW